jgi:hypothetical protein
MILIQIIHRNLVLSHRKHTVSRLQNKYFNAVHCENHTKEINILCGKTVDFVLLLKQAVHVVTTSKG